MMEISTCDLAARNALKAAASRYLCSSSLPIMRVSILSSSTKCGIKLATLLLMLLKIQLASRLAVDLRHIAAVFSQPTYKLGAGRD